MPRTILPDRQNPVFPEYFLSRNPRSPIHAIQPPGGPKPIPGLELSLLIIGTGAAERSQPPGPGVARRAEPKQATIARALPFPLHPGKGQLQEQSVSRQEGLDPIRPLNDQDSPRREGLLKAELIKLARTPEPVGIIVTNRHPPLVYLLENVGRTVHPRIIRAARSADQPPGEGRLARPQITDQGENLTSRETLSKLAGNLEGFLSAPCQSFNTFHLGGPNLPSRPPPIRHSTWQNGLSRLRQASG